MKMIPVLTAVALMLAAGCSTPSPQFSAPTNSAPVYRADGSPMIRRAVVVGVKRFNPDFYGGQTGYLSDTESDADVISMLARQKGLETLDLRTEKATIYAFKQGLLNAVKDMQAGDLLFVYVSGHGGQREDLSGDEPDRLDETICLYDGEIIDDDMWRLFTKAPSGVRVAYVTDTCNAGSNWKSIPSDMVDAPKGWEGRLFHIGGCADGKSSYSTGSGGRLTVALFDAWTAGISWEAWFNGAQSKMPMDQRPVMNEFGESFASGKAFE